jgi:hypothetical protein
VDSAAQYVYGTFNLSAPGADIGRAAAWLANPGNYEKLGLDSAEADQAASQVQAQWARQQQAAEEARKRTDENFERLAAGGQIPAGQLMGWKDPQTGLQPDIGKVKQVQEWMANPPTVTHSDPETMVKLSGGISDRRLSDKGPINAAYFQGKLTESDWRKLSDFQATSTDISRSGWFVYARDAYYARYGSDIGDGGSEIGEIRPPSVTLFPRFMMDLDGVIRDGDLKGAQVRELTNRMLDDVERLYQAEKG